MGLLGEAAMVGWYTVTPEAASEHDDWHSHEHMPERLGIPGFLRGRRWVSLSRNSRYFVMYEVDHFETLTAPPYLDRLNNPTPWSKKMMLHFRNMTRSLCRVKGSFGTGVGQAVVTIRFSPKPGAEEALREWLTGSVLPTLSPKPGMIGVHLLESEKQTEPPQAREQVLRGGDMTADWVVVVEGYDPAAVLSIGEEELGMEVLSEHGAIPEQVTEAYRLGFLLTRGDSDPET
jgi:hypothetical protein